MASQKGDPMLLFTGVALIAVAIIINAIAYKRQSAKQIASHHQKELLFL